MKTIHSIEEAVKLLKRNAVIAYPTETFYGIGCSAYSEEAVKRIFEIKQRNITFALPLIVRDFEQVLEIATINKKILSSVEEITSNFWPQSLSILLKAKKHISPIITANTGTIVVRQSPHTIPQILTELINAPLISTSANKSGEAPAQKAEEFNQELEIDALLDMGETPSGGLASTIIEIMPDKKIKVLRNGAFDLKGILELGYSLSN